MINLILAAVLTTVGIIITIIITLLLFSHKSNSKTFRIK